MLRALAVTQVAHVAAPAVRGQGVAFVGSEFLLAITPGHVTENSFIDVADPIVGVNIVVARKYIAVVFHDQSVAAGFGEHTEAGTHVHVIAQCDIEELHERGAHVAPHPFVKNSHEKTAEILRTHTPVGDR